MRRRSHSQSTHKVRAAAGRAATRRRRDHFPGADCRQLGGEGGEARRVSPGHSPAPVAFNQPVVSQPVSVAELRRLNQSYRQPASIRRAGEPPRTRVSQGGAKRLPPQLGPLKRRSPLKGRSPLPADQATASVSPNNPPLRGMCLTWLAPTVGGAPRANTRRHRRGEMPRTPRIGMVQPSPWSGTGSRGRAHPTQRAGALGPVTQHPPLNSPAREVDGGACSARRRRRRCVVPPDRAGRLRTPPDDPGRRRRPPTPKPGCFKPATCGRRLC